MNVFAKAMRDLLAPGLLRLFVYSLLLTLAILGVFIYGMTQIIHLLLHPTPESSTIMTWIAGLGASLIAWFLFPVVMPIIASFLDEAIAEAIEKYEYPALPVGKSHPFLPELWQDVRFTMWALSLNLLCIIIYILLFLILLPFLSVFIFYVLNGYLLGTQFFMMAGGRHIGRKESRKLAQKHRFKILLAGTALVFMATLPLLNLIAPFWGIAVMVHLYHSLSPIEAPTKA